jgi:membrane-associated protease RseP (regulator of RpoE activity)
MKAYRVIQVLFFLLILLAGNPSEAGEFEFHWEDGLCSLKAKDALVNDILAEVSDVTGVPIYTDPADDSRMTISFEARDLETLIKAVASSSTITWEQDPVSGEYYMASVSTAGSVKPHIKQQQARERVVREQNLRKHLPTEVKQELKYSGIGARVLLNKTSDALWIRPIDQQSPSALAGLREGDQVVQINGRPVKDFSSLSEIIRTLRGREGTTVVLYVREPDGNLVTRSVTRRSLHYEPKK